MRHNHECREVGEKTLMSRCVQSTAHELPDLSDRVVRAVSIECGAFAYALRPLHDSYSLNCDGSSAVDRFRVWKAFSRNPKIFNPKSHAKT